MDIEESHEHVEPETTIHLFLPEEKEPGNKVYKVEIGQQTASGRYFSISVAELYLEDPPGEGRNEPELEPTPFVEEAKGVTQYDEQEILERWLMEERDDYTEPRTLSRD